MATAAAALGLALGLVGAMTVQGADAPTAALPAPTGALAGVLCVNGVPTPGTVEVRAAARDGELPVATGAPLRTTQTDASGAFAIDGLAVGAYEVRGRPQYGATAWSRAEVPGAIVVAVPLRSPGGPHIVRGRVRDVDGTPFRGWVSLARWRSWFVTDLTSTLGSTWVETNAEGQFEIAGVATGAATLTAARAGYRETLVQEAWFPADGPLEFRVGSGDHQLRGRAIGPDGEPVSGARVRAIAWWDEGVRITAADGAGRFEVRVPPGCESISVEADGLLGGSIPWPSRNTEVTVRLARGTTVSGIVRDTNRRPVVGTRVIVASIGGSDATLERWATSDTNGHYLVEDVPPGDAWVFAVGASFASPGLAHDRKDGLSVVVPSAGLGHDLVVEPAPRARVRVRDATGAPLASARVVLSPTGLGAAVAQLESTAPFVGGRTGPKGILELDTILPGPEWHASVYAEGAVPFHAAKPIRVGSGFIVVDAMVPAPRFFEVRVVNDTGEPVRGASLDVAIQSVHGGWVSDHAWRWVSDAGGRARVGPVPEGRASVTAEADGFRSTKHVPLVVGAVAIVRMVAAPGIAGVVRGPAELDGRAVAVAVQRVASKDHSWASPEMSIITRVGFSFRTGALEGDAYDVSAEATSADGMRWTRSIRTSAAGDPIVVTLERRPSATLIVRVVDAHGTSVPAADAIFLPDGGGASVSVQVRAGEGVIEVPEGVRRGRLVVRNARDDRDRSLALAAYEGDAIDLNGNPAEVRLVAERAMFGRVVDTAGRPVAGVAVEAHVIRTTAAPDFHLLRAEASATTDELGRFRIHGLAARAYRIDTIPPEGYAEPEPTLIGANSAGPLALTVLRGKSVVLSVIDAENAPVPRASVMLWWRSSDGVQRGHRGSWISQNTDDDGRVRFDGIVVGRDYQLQVLPPDTRTDLGQVDRSPWLPDDAEIRLQRQRVVSGVVLDERDRPMSSVAVRWRLVEGKPEWRTTHTDAEGRFTLRDLPREPIEIQAGPRVPGQVGVRVDGAREDLILRVDVSRSLVVRIDGVLARDAVVRLGGSAGATPLIRLSGSSVLPGVPVRWTDLNPASRYALYVGPFARGGCYYREGLVPGDGDVVAVAAPGVTVRGLLVGATGVSRAQVGRAGVTIDITVGADGRFATPPLPAGMKWTLTFVADGVLHTKEFVATEGETIEVPLSR